MSFKYISRRFVAVFVLLGIILNPLLVLGAEVTNDRVVLPVVSQASVDPSVSGVSVVPGELLVTYKKQSGFTVQSAGQAQSAIRTLATNHGAEVRGILQEGKLGHFAFDESIDLDAKMAELASDPQVAHVQPNYQYSLNTLGTNDTWGADLWGLHNTGQTVTGIIGKSDADIDMPEAWAVAGTSTLSEVIVAVLDTGVRYNHNDIDLNMWNGSNCVHASTTIAQGGCVHGYDFEEDDLDPLPIAQSGCPSACDNNGTHGTHVAGTIAAIRNNAKGTAGVASNVKIMALRSTLTTTQIVDAIAFADANGAKIMNMSFGGSSSNDDSLMYNAMASSSMLFIVAAGNSGVNNDAQGTATTTGHFYPSDFDLPNIISVAATDQNDALATFSNYGATSVDVAAPGVNIWSLCATIEIATSTECGYTTLQGTSMAVPHVAGLAGLLMGFSTTSTNAQIKNAILSGGDSLAVLATTTVTGKRINAFGSLQAVATQNPVITLIGSSTVTIDRDTVWVDAGATSTSGYGTHTITATGTVDTTTIGTTILTYTVTDGLMHTASTTRSVSVVFPSSATNSEAATTLSTATTTATLGATSTKLEIIIPSEITTARLDLSSYASTTSTSTVVNVPVNIGAFSSSSRLSFATGTKLTVASSTWEANLALLQQQLSTAVAVTPTSGYTASNELIIKVGNDEAITLDRAVRIVFVGKAGKQLAATQGITTTKITTTCSADTQAAGDALAEGGDCKMTVGNDLVLWTKHFTLFTIYTETAIPPAPAPAPTSSGGGGGGGGAAVPVKTTTLPAPTGDIEAQKALLRKLITELIIQLIILLQEELAKAN